MKWILLVTALSLAACGLRVGTDPQASTANGATEKPLLIATWFKDSADSSVVFRQDTLGFDSLLATAFPLPESTSLSLVSMDSSWCAWVRPGMSFEWLDGPRRIMVRWSDARLRPGLTFVLPGTGVEIPLDSSEGWTGTTISVFARSWPARIVHLSGGRRVVWHLDSLPLRDTLSLDLSALPDSSCPIQPGTVPSLWECRPR